ncbi:MAG: NAD(P)H-hydrate dehydratase [Oscillospiraceae bacterium]|nr:NAD(P)H-hydrate dehydratase [Oscillospiraceae bacterium]
MKQPFISADEAAARARELFMQGYNCAQSVAGSFYEELGVSRQQALAMSAGFGAGFARLRETCGAVSGMVLVLGAVLQRGAARPEDKQLVYETVQKEILGFEAENGSYICRDLLGLLEKQKDAPVPSQRDAAYYAARPCLRLVENAARRTAQWLEKRHAQEAEQTDPVLLDEVWFAAHAPVRPADGHKGTFGKVLAVCGSEQYRGAAALCCEGALRSGAGLVQLAAPAAVCNAVAARLPEVTFLPLTGDAAQNAALAADGQKKASALVLGCGLGQSEAAAALVSALCVPQALPAVLDADALNLLAAVPQPLAMTPSPARVLTPHIGEMARLMNMDTAEVLADQTGIARRAASDWGSVVVLKSSRTVIAAPDGRTLLLDAPNSGLAKGGSGDVLAGVIAGLLAQGMPAFEAAGCGVWLHSAAARRAAEERGPAAMLPGDILRYLWS